MTPSTDMNPAPWPVYKKVLFRFGFALMLLFMAPLLFIPYIGELLSAAYYKIPVWIEGLLHIEAGTHEFTGSGDRTDDFVMAGFQIVAAAVICIVWSLLDRKRPHYQKLSHGLWVVTRYYLSIVLFGYGIVKVIMIQFGFPTLTQLNTPLGNFTPFRLTWLFMGYSEGYNFFTGMVECVAALLLLPRRTVTLGALLSVTAMTQVLVLNLAYDITVKLFAAQLLLLGIYLLKGDAVKLWQLFVQRKAVQLAQHKLVLPKRWQRITRIVLKTAIILYYIAWPVYENWQSYQEEKKEPQPPLYGHYEVTQFVRNNDTLPFRFDDTVRWCRLVLDYYRRGTVFFMNQQTLRHRYKADTVQHNITFDPMSDSTQRFVLRYEQQDSVHYLLSGTRGSDSLRILLRKRNQSFRLVTHGFHWISESPW